MSYSFRIPEDDTVCECKYDPVLDRMDWDDCRFHCEIADAPAKAEAADRKQAASGAEEPNLRQSAKTQQDLTTLKSQVKIQYDPEADVLSILFIEPPVLPSDEEQTNVIFDYDKHGSLIGLGFWKFPNTCRLATYSTIPSASLGGVDRLPRWIVAHPFCPDAAPIKTSCVGECISDKESC